MEQNGIQSYRKTVVFLESHAGQRTKSNETVNQNNFQRFV